jgi:hypothetical protein
MAFLPDKQFPSLVAAFDFILKEYALRASERLWFKTGSGLLISDEVPQYLFRGECGAFETTKAGIFRPEVLRLEERIPLSSPDLQMINELVPDLARRFTKDDYSLDEHQSIGLLQHYGLPTWLIDFTGHLGYAFAFAAAGESPVGRVAVMPSRLANAARRLVDLRENPWAERARRQAAFGSITTDDLRDLKSDEARSQFNVRWYEFAISREDHAFLKDRHAQLVSLSDDPNAGFLRFHVTEYVEERGKFSPRLVEWLLKRIPMAPRCYRVRAFEARDVVVNHCEGSVLPVAFDEPAEAERSRRYWSSAHTERSLDRMTNWSWPEEGSIVADPRTYHPDLYPAPQVYPLVTG